MNWKIVIIALFVPLFATAAETELEHNGAKSTLKTTGTTVNRYAKPGAPVELSYTVPKQVGSGNTVVVELVFSTQSDVGELNVRIVADDGLIMNDLANSSFNIVLAENANSYPASISITSTIEGLFYVNVFASMDVGGNTLNRAFSVPVQVGSYEPELKSTGDLDIDENGNPIIILPAIEVIE